MEVVTLTGGNCRRRDLAVARGHRSEPDAVRTRRSVSARYTSRRGQAFSAVQCMVDALCSASLTERLQFRSSLPSVNVTTCTVYKTPAGTAASDGFSNRGSGTMEPLA